MPRKEKAEAQLTPFFFPDIHNGITIYAVDLEEAQEKALAVSPS